MNTIYYYNGSGTTGSFTGGSFSNGYGTQFGFTIKVLYGTLIDALNPTITTNIPAPGALPSIFGLTPAAHLFNNTNGIFIGKMILDNQFDYVSSDGTTVIGRLFTYLTQPLATGSGTFFGKWVVPTFNIVFGTDQINVQSQQGQTSGTITI